MPMTVSYDLRIFLRRCLPEYFSYTFITLNKKWNTKDNTNTQGDSRFLIKDKLQIGYF